MPVDIISLALFNLKMTNIFRDRTMSLTLDDLFSRYTEFLHLLSPNALTWLFILVTLFFHSLPLDLQEVVRFGGYILSHLSQLYTYIL